MTLLSTKFYVPHAPPSAVARQRLVERLNDGAQRKLTLISAPAGFGKTTLVSEWVPGQRRPAAWLSLDESDNDPARFLTGLIAALQTIMPGIGEQDMSLLRSPEPPSAESVLTGLLNEIAARPDPFTLVLDDYHVVDVRAVDQALAFLLEHLPPQMHILIATREDPDLPLARLRGRGQLTELRAADLRFSTSEAAEFLNHGMGLALSADDVAALEARTEGWIAGLQLAAISMQGHDDAQRFIKSFTGSHRFVMDYLVEEVLQRQPEDIQAFLLGTSILERMCGPLCDAVLPEAAGRGQPTLEHLEQANLFVVPLDDERRWYRYHHLFAELLRQRLQHSRSDVSELHARASAWFEDNGFEIEAFQHAGAANDIQRARRLLEAGGTPLFLRGGMLPSMKWLKSLPDSTLDAAPRLWVLWASALLADGQMSSVEAKLQRAETALRSAAPDEAARDLHGQIAAARAMVAVGHYDIPTILAQASRALDYLDRDNFPARFRAQLALANAHEIQGEHAAVASAYEEALSIARAGGSSLYIGVATTGVGQGREYANQLHAAAEDYRSSVKLLADQRPPILSYAYLGLGRILLEWNDLAAAEQHLQQGLQLALRYDRDIDVFIMCEVVRARLMLARGEPSEAAALLARADETARQRNFAPRIPEIAAAQVLTLLQQGDLTAAAALASSVEIPMSRARVLLAQGDPAAALAVLEPLRAQMKARGWQDEVLRLMVLQARALHAHEATDKAVDVLGEALALAEPGGFLRMFLDEGPQMAGLLSEAATRGIMADYARRLLAAFGNEQRTSVEGARPASAQPLIEPLSGRELEILQLIARGLSNQDISRRLFLALSTVKGHNRLIFNKLQVQSRTEAVARARELGLL